jgi:phosphoserine phosphatase RsbU/P
MSIYIEDLRESNDFLNTLLDHMNSAVIIVDQEGMIHHFNDVFLSIFDKDPGEVDERRCGEAMGCFHSVGEKKRCGDTSQCAKCPLRLAIAAAYNEKVPVVKT